MTVNNAKRWPLWVFWLGIFLLGNLMAWNNALTTSADLLRNQIEFKSWQPYVWEFSSFISTFLLYFAVYWLASKKPLVGSKWPANLLLHLMATVLFSWLHVASMVWLRQIIYVVMGGQYDFGNWGSEWLYEYRKDVITYFAFLLSYYAFDYFSKSKITPVKTSTHRKLKVKNKQGITWVNHADIVTIESGGNYIYIHANSQVLPMRSTMAGIEKQLESENFIRAHRSYLVNLLHCKGLQKQSADSSMLIMINGREVPVSKKYRAELMVALQQTHH